MIRIGDNVITPRFGVVTISRIFYSREEMWAAGFREPTYCDCPLVYGKPVDYQDRNGTSWIKFEWAALEEARE